MSPSASSKTKHGAPLGILPVRDYLVLFLLLVQLRLQHGHAYLDHLLGLQVIWQLRLHVLLQTLKEERTKHLV